MSLPADGVNANTLAETTTIPTGKKLIFLDPDTNEGGIITLENLTKQILSNLTSQTFNLDQGNKTLLAALNELNSNAVPKKLLFEHTSIEATYKGAKVGISFCKAQGASDFPLPSSLTLIINVKSGEEWGMQYALTSAGKIFTRPVNNGVFVDWIQV